VRLKLVGVKGPGGSAVVETVAGIPGGREREPGGKKIALGVKTGAEGDGGRRWPARGLGKGGEAAVGKGRRVASLAERLGGDDDVPRPRGTIQESVEGGRRGGKGKGEGGVVAPARGRDGGCGKPTLE